MTMRIGGILAFLVAMMGPAGIAHGAKPGSSVNVTTTVHDNDPTGTQLLMRSDDYNGTGQATYSPTNVPSYIFSNGTWFLRLYGQSVRTLYITPNDAINSSQPTGPPAGYYWQNVEVAVACYDQNLNLVPFQNILTSSGNCKMIVDFGYNGTEYKMVMGPNLPAPGPATGLTSVVCNSVSSGQCVSWTISPNITAGSPNPMVADLYQFTNDHKNVLQFVGQYYYTYRVDVTNP